MKKLAANNNNNNAYVRGERAVWLQLLKTALRELGHDLSDAENKLVRLIAERERVVAALRSACNDHGDNAWSPEDDLVDVIDGHLMCYLDERG